MAVSIIGPKFYAWDRNGKPLAFGKLYTYQARTNTPKPTYQSEDQQVENTNPVILNGEGYANVYLDGSYKMVLKDKDENEIWSSDPVTSASADEWTNCYSAVYVSSTSFKFFGNQTAEYRKDRKVRIDNNTTEYAYTKIVSSTYANGETSVVVADPVVATSVGDVCTSIVSSDSSFNKSDLSGLTNYQANNVDDMVQGITVGGQTVALEVGQVWTINGKWKYNGGTSGTIADFDPVGCIFVDDFDPKGDANSDSEALTNALGYEYSVVKGTAGRTYTVIPQIPIANGVEFDLNRCTLKLADNTEARAGVFTTYRNSGTFGTPTTIISTKDITIHNGFVDGNKANQNTSVDSTEYAIGFFVFGSRDEDASRCSNCEVHNVQFKNIHGSGVLQYDGTNIRVHHCIGNGFEVAKTSGGERFAGSLVQMQGGIRCSADDNIVDFLSSTDPWHCITMLSWDLGMSQSSANRNKTLGGEDGISWEANSLNKGAAGCQCSENQIKDCSGQMIDYQFAKSIAMNDNIGINVGAGLIGLQCESFTANDNDIDGVTSGAGIYTNNLTGSATVSGNKIKDVVGSPPGVLEIGHGIYIVAVTDVDNVEINISDNTTENTDGPGIFTQGFANWDNNTVINPNSASSAQNQAVNYAGSSGCRFGKVTNNTVVVKNTNTTFGYSFGRLPRLAGNQVRRDTVSGAFKNVYIGTRYNTQNADVDWYNNISGDWTDLESYGEALKLTLTDATQPSNLSAKGDIYHVSPEAASFDAASTVSWIYYSTGTSSNRAYQNMP